MKKSDNSATDILFKPTEKLTEQELKEARKYAYYESKDPEVAKQILDKTTEGYNFFYGTEEAKKDATGRYIDPLPKVAIPTEVTPLKTADGRRMDEAFKLAARDIAHIDANPTFGSGVAAQQRGINLMRKSPILKEDADLGPKTVFQMKKTLVEEGSKKNENSVKSRRFRQFSREK